MNSRPRIGVLGIGSILMGDDGIGPFVAKILQACYEFPPNVVLHDLGIPGLPVTSFFADYDIIILIDAVSAKAQPGSIRLYRKDQIVRTSVPQRIRPHDPALVESLLFAEPHRLHAEPVARTEREVPSISWQEKVVSEGAAGEASYVPGYPG